MMQPSSEPIFRVPHADPGGALIGRAAELNELDRLLRGSNAAAVTVLQGTGGIGKTQLAAAYCHAYRRDWPGGVVWLSFADPGRAMEELAAWAREVDPSTGDMSREARATALLGRLRGRIDALLVLDNLEDWRKQDPFADGHVLDLDLPGLPNSAPRRLGCRLLVTSRAPVPDCANHPLSFLRPPADRSLVLREAGRAPPSAAGEAAMEEVMGMLGGLPLALILVGRLLRDRPRLSFTELRDVLRRGGAVVVLTKAGTLPPDYRERLGASMAAVMGEVWGLLAKPEDNLARQVLLALSALGESLFVPEAALPLLVEPPPPDPLEPDWNEAALERLTVLQMVERHAEARAVRLHPLIREFAACQQPEGFVSELAAGLDRRLGSVNRLLALPAAALPAITGALESFLASTRREDEVAQRICRLLRLQAHALWQTRDPTAGLATAAQLAYSAGLHGLDELKNAAEAAIPTGKLGFSLRWSSSSPPVEALRQRLRGHESWVFCCAVSADGKTGLSGSGDNTLIVWDLERCLARHRLEGHHSWVHGCAVSANGQIGLSGAGDCTLIVWDLARGEARYHLQGHESEVRGCAISADGTLGLSASLDNTLILWDLERGEARHRLRGHARWVLRCAMSANGALGLSASLDGTVIVWDLLGGRERHRLRGHTHKVADCAISADGTVGLSASEDCTLIVWNLLEGTERYRLRSHVRGVVGCAISADGTIGLSASDDKVLIVWNLTRGEALNSLQGHESGVSDCAVSADGRIGLSASDDRTLILWDLAQKEAHHLRQPHADRVLSSAICANGALGLSASLDGTLIVWDLEHGDIRHRLRGHDHWVRGCAVSADGRLGLSASEDCTLIVWDLERGEARHQLRGHSGQGSWLTDCAVSADGRLGLSASSDGTLIVWDLKRGRRRHRLEGHDRTVRSCAVSANGRLGLSASSDRTLIVWDLERGRRRDYLISHNDAVTGCAVSADGRLGLSASEDCTLIVWDLERGLARHRLEGHQRLVRGCAVNADGTLGLSASDDGMIVLWDLARGEARHFLALSTNPTCVAIDAVGRHILIGDGRGDVTCLRIEPP